MLIFNPTKREMKQGLRKRPTYDNVVDTIIKDVPIKLPNRDAKFLRDSMAYSQLDNLTAFESMQEQQMSVLREQQKENIMRHAAADDPSVGMANLQANAPEPKRTAEFHDVGTDAAHMETDEDYVAQNIGESGERSKQRKLKMNKKTRVHLINLRTRVNELMKPSTEDKGVGTDAPGSSDMQTQTDARRSSDMQTQTDPEPVPNPNPLHLNEKSKAKVKKEIKEEKVKKERKKRVPKQQLKEELKKEEPKGEMKDEVIKLEPKYKPKREASRSRGRGRPKKEEPKAEVKQEEVKKEEVKKETKEEKRGRSRSRTKTEPKAEEPPKSRKRAKSEAPEQKDEKRIKIEPAVKAEPANAVKTEPEAKARAKSRAKSSDNNNGRADNVQVINAEPKAKARAKSRAKTVDKDVRATDKTLNNNNTREYWANNASANEIKNQLRLRGVPEDIWIYKDKAALVRIIVKVINGKLK
jgi:hypothetical protein